MNDEASAEGFMGIRLLISKANSKTLDFSEKAYIILIINSFSCRSQEYSLFWDMPFLLFLFLENFKVSSYAGFQVYEGDL